MFIYIVHENVFQIKTLSRFPILTLVSGQYINLVIIHKPFRKKDK